MQTIEEYAMENGISFEEAQRQLEADEAPAEREPPKKRQKKVSE